MRVELEPAYILHTRPYRETSLLVYALTYEHGVMHMICRGARKKGNHLLQPFIKMHLSWTGKGELVTLTKYELEKSSYRNDFRTHIQCFYLHELILALIPKMSPAPELFELYEQTLDSMTAEPQNEAILRFFELQLLTIIGHPLQLEYDCRTQQPLLPQADYIYQPDAGPTQVSAADTPPGQPKGWNRVSGHVLLQLQQHELAEQDWSQAKSFLRGLIKYHLHGKPIMTRQLLGAK